MLNFAAKLNNIYGKGEGIAFSFVFVRFKAKLKKPQQIREVLCLQKVP